MRAIIPSPECNVIGEILQLREFSNASTHTILSWPLPRFSPSHRFEIFVARSLVMDFRLGVVKVCFLAK